MVPRRPVPRSITADTWGRSRIRLALIGVLCLKILGLVVLFDWGARTLFPFDLVKAVWSRGTEWLLVGLLLLAVFRFGTAIVPRTPVHVVIAGVVLANALATVFAEERFIALFGYRSKYLGLTFVVDMAVLYLAMATAFLDRRDWLRLFTAFAVAAVLSILYALAQYGGYDPLPWSIDSAVRPFSTIGNPDTYGHFVTVSLVAAAAVAATPSDLATRWRATALVIALVALLVTVLVAARGSVLGIGAALLIAPLVAHRFHGLHGPALRRLIALEGAALGAAIAATAFSPLGRRLVDTLGGAGLRERILTWQASISAFLDRPLLGYGPDGFAVLWPRYRPVEMAFLAPQVANDSAHSYLLQAAATTGLVGLLGAVALLAVPVVLLYRRGDRDAFVASVCVIVVCAFAAQAMVSVNTAAVDWIPWAIAAGAVVLTTEGSGSSVAVRSTPRAFVAAVVAATLVLGGMGLRVLQADRDAFAARKAADLGQGPLSVERGTSAVQLDPNRAEHWSELGRGFFAARRFRDSLDAFEHARALFPEDSIYLSNAAKAIAQLVLVGDLSRGDADAALVLAREAVATDPNDLTPHVALVEIASALGRPDDALAALVGVFRLSGAQRYQDLAAQLSARATDLASARAALEESVAIRDSATLRVALGRLALRQGDRPAALANALRALALRPGDVAAEALARDAGG